MIVYLEKIAPPSPLPREPADEFLRSNDLRVLFRAIRQARRVTIWIAHGLVRAASSVRCAVERTHLQSRNKRSLYG